MSKFIRRTFYIIIIHTGPGWDGLTKTREN
ncbi:hypothetical protein GGR27_003625 [Lewinella antarctica]|uniref:Uncharacterized protein n=1 Tax=Neolewinella antarctica TaxID=442734 RepID=A0ABX0XFJ9_9BACT|nr:hypothetical protein [Neolewinella antarctica]